MRKPFVSSILKKMSLEGHINQDQSILTVCAGQAEHALFQELGFSNVVVSNLDVRMQGHEFEPYDWSFQDVQTLTFEDASFDWVFVADGLHHCSSPHRALTEMYRVSKKGVIVFESRDSFSMRFAQKVGLTPEYELEAVIDHNFEFGGQDNTHIPNHIYRWTENEFKKTLKSYDAAHNLDFRFYYGLSLPFSAARFKKTNIKYISLLLLQPFIKVFTLLFKKQANLFCMVAIKDGLEKRVWPWLKYQHGSIAFNKDYAQKNFAYEPHDKHS